MILYAESSAVLNWLFDQARAGEIVSLLEAADRVFASELTLVECERSIVRETHRNVVTKAAASELVRALRRSGELWSIVDLGREILDRARQPFPEEPLRTLDAIHLASALVCRRGLPEIGLLSLDQRVRRSATALGFEVFPR